MLHFCTFAPEFKVKEYKMIEFMTPPKHVNFRAKKLFGAVGNIVDGAVAYIDLNGGGPTELHTHEHNHLFIVTEGEAKILLGEEEVIIHKDEAFLVEGRIPHSCWNNIEGVTKMIGITVI
jgi:mannose-6-phosphate isomerase-like protein (cupin superfamily)